MRTVQPANTILTHQCMHQTTRPRPARMIRYPLQSTESATMYHVHPIVPLRKRKSLSVTTVILTDGTIHDLTSNSDSDIENLMHMDSQGKYMYYTISHLDTFSDDDNSSGLAATLKFTKSSVVSTFPFNTLNFLTKNYAADCAVHSQNGNYSWQYIMVK